jgi:transcription elongation GreA/GreB family factor
MAGASDVFDKRSLKDELRKILAEGLAARERAHRASIEGATHEEARPENDKDTRALEQSYLARGEAMRVEELRSGLAAVDAMTVRMFAEDARAALGALVTVEEDERALVLWLAPDGGGARLAGGRVQVVTPQSPLGAAVLGKQAGDEATLRAGAKLRELTVVRVA